MNKELFRIRVNKLRYSILSFLFSDLKYNKWLFKKYKKKQLNINTPLTLSEKLIFLKLFYRTPLLTLCSDKLNVSEYVRLCGYDEINKKIYGVYNDFDDINFDNLPRKFFIKMNHISGYNYFIKDKYEMNINMLRKVFKLLKKINHYNVSREWAYKNIQPKIIIEEALIDSDGSLPTDYKFYCFGGEPKYFMVSKNEYFKKPKNHKFDMELNSIDHKFKSVATLSLKEAVLPDNIKEMIEVVKKLCSPFPHVRVDLYSVKNKIYFGELTFYSGGGFVNIFSEKMDNEIGEWIDLDNYKDNIINSRNFSSIKKI